MLHRFRTEIGLIRPEFRHAHVLALVQRHSQACTRFDRFQQYVYTYPQLYQDRESMRRGRLTPVRIDELPADAPGFDGHSFTADYRAAVG